jgi:hypothetical protein
MCDTLANRFGLSFGGHTLAAYHSLPFGWRTAPDGVPTDLHMWRQFLLEPGVRAKTLFLATALNFAALPRQGWSHLQRLQELDKWLSESGAADFQMSLNRKLSAARRKHAFLDTLARMGLPRRKRKNTTRIEF